MEELKGVFVSEIYKAPDSAYKVVLVKANNKNYTLSGNLPLLEEGLSYVFYGDFVNHPKYGKQFKVTSYKRIKDTKAGLITYLSSDKFYGIGKKTATKLVEILGEDALLLITKNKEVLDKIPNLTKAKKQLIYEQVKANSEEDATYIELYNYGLTPKMANKLYEQYGTNTLNLIKENPYRLIYDVVGFGFKKADNLAMSLGINADNEIRIKEAILYTLTNSCYQDGNCYILVNDLIKLTNNYLNIDTKLITDSLEELKDKRRLVQKDTKVYPNVLYNAEFKVAQYLKQLANAPFRQYEKAKIEQALKSVEASNSFSYTVKQKETLAKILNDKVAIITGGPGTGKTTIVKGIIKMFNKLNNVKNDPSILLLAPTGRAAKRLKEANGLEAYTIHKALGYDYTGEFSFNEFNRLPYDLIIIDEASMIDIELAYHLLEAINTFSQVIFIGDENQLPSVGPGEFLHDLINSKAFSVYRLTEVMRQVADSNIIKLANMILNQNLDFNIFKEHREVFFYQADKTNLLNVIKRIMDNYLSKGNVLNNLQILIPLYQGIVGINEVNKFIQTNYNPHKEVMIKHGDLTFYPDDKVLQLQNDPEKGIMNGDIGYIVDIFADSVGVDFTGKIVRLASSDLDNLTLAYAISIHKSQGSEYENVIFPILSSYSLMLKRKLIYTAITRAKQKLIILGDLELLKHKSKIKEQLRNTSLMEFLEEKKEITPYDFM